MKKIIIISILLLVIVHFATGELTEKDLEKISDLLDKQEKRIKEYVDLRIEAVRAEIKAVRAEIEAVRTEVKAVKAQIEYIKWFITALIVIIVALIGIPQTVQLWRERKESKQIDMLNREIERLNRDYEKLSREMEELKKRKFYGES